MRDKKGLLTFEVDLDTGEVKEADWKPGSIFISYSAVEGTNETRTYLLVERPNCRYLKALNLRNAKRKSHY